MRLPPSRRLVRSRGRTRVRGYALLDVILAVTVFAFWGVGLITLLQKISDTSNSYSRDRLIQYQLESLLTEMKHRPIDEMVVERYDEALDVTFATTLEPANLANNDGEALEDLYELVASATFTDSGGEQTETARLTIYQPEEDRRR